MKTTIEIADALFLEAKRVAAEEGITLRQLVEQGLHRVLDERRRAESFKLRDASYEGSGLTPEARELTWTEVLDLSYAGRGG